ncbi:hypothetical protein [Streptomyces sp. LS1784]|uniref:hypothetical protein n=1 Tax=Streptomyces sp. LS1784 TaxID=2851533 RepID=UPI001CC9D097|nr:hypothetical protein [Streptomyces sp. LS1784]
MTATAFAPPPIGAKVIITAWCATHHRAIGHERFTWTEGRHAFQFVGCGQSNCRLGTTTTYTRTATA